MKNGNYYILKLFHSWYGGFFCFLLVFFLLINPFRKMSIILNQFNLESYLFTNTSDPNNATTKLHNFFYYFAICFFNFLIFKPHILFKILLSLAKNVENLKPLPIVRFHCRHLKQMFNMSTTVFETFM